MRVRRRFPKVAMLETFAWGDRDYFRFLADVTEQTYLEIKVKTIED